MCCLILLLFSSLLFASFLLFVFASLRFLTVASLNQALCFSLRSCRLVSPRVVSPVFIFLQSFPFHRHILLVVFFFFLHFFFSILFRSESRKGLRKSKDQPIPCAPPLIPCRWCSGMQEDTAGVEEAFAAADDASGFQGGTQKARALSSRSSPLTHLARSSVQFFVTSTSEAFLHGTTPPPLLSYRRISRGTK